MKSLKTISFLMLAVLFMASCTVERRLHNKGLHVEWNKKYKASKGEQDVAEKTLRITGEDQETASGIAEVIAAADVVEPTQADRSSASNRAVTEDVASISDEPSTERSRRNYAQNNVIDEQTGVDFSWSSNDSTDEIENEEDKAEVAEGTTGGKSQVIALILVILLGLLGVHRFYLGYPGIGILMILTAGCCGILALVDLIMIITGDLKPKYSEYTETL